MVLIPLLNSGCYNHAHEKDFHPIGAPNPLLKLSVPHYHVISNQHPHFSSYLKAEVGPPFPSEPTGLVLWPIPGRPLRPSVKGPLRSAGEGGVILNY